jgi:hypothetical protein
MFLFPFHTVYLSSALNREKLAEKLRSVSYLSDAHFKKQKDNPCTFYGEISSIDFNLEHISKKQAGVNFIQGRFLGADEEMFIELKLGAWKHKRIYMLLLLILISTLSFLLYYAGQNPHGFATIEEYYHIYGFGKSTLLYNLNTPLAWLMEFISLVIFAIIFVKYHYFKKLEIHSIDYLRGLWNAQIVTPHEVPQVFLR